MYCQRSIDHRLAPPDIIEMTVPPEYPFAASSKNELLVIRPVGRFPHIVLAFCLVLVSCGSRYRCERASCDQPLGKQGGPISFSYEGQKVEVCSEEHRAEFFKEPARYMAEIKEVKVL